MRFYVSSSGCVEIEESGACSLKGGVYDVTKLCAVCDGREKRKNHRKDVAVLDQEHHIRG